MTLLRHTWHNIFGKLKWGIDTRKQEYLSLTVKSDSSGFLRFFLSSSIHLNQKTTNHGLSTQVQIKFESLILKVRVVKRVTRLSDLAASVNKAFMYVLLAWRKCHLVSSTQHGWNSSILKYCTPLHLRNSPLYKIISGVPGGGQVR